MSAKTIGEQRVRTEFNPSNDSMVDKIKQKSAELINLVDSLKTDKNVIDNPERNRLISIAMTKYEEAAMFGVKAATV